MAVLPLLSLQENKSYFTGVIKTACGYQQFDISSIETETHVEVFYNIYTGIKGQVLRHLCILY